MRRFVFAFAAAYLIFLSVVHADDSSNIKPLPPVTMQDGNVFAPMRFAVIGRYAYFDQNRIFTGASEDDPGFGKRRRTAHAGQLTLRAGLPAGFEVLATGTLWDKTVERENAKGATDESDVSGLGDIQLMVRYQLLSQKNGAPLSLAAGLGLEIPTGDCDNENSFGTQPYFGPFLQLGTGAWTPKATMSATRVFGRSRLDGQLMYVLGTEGEHHIEKGDQFLYNLGYGYALNSFLTAGLALNGIHQDKNTQELSPGVIGHDPNSGCDLIFLGPELSWNIKPWNTVLGLALPVSVYRDMEGSQPTEDYRLVAKIAVRF
ncbi:MAG: transporter [Deltaproteobacteria bacterium]|nr:transporter [Deltaproteobacteria bacterium]